VKRIIGANPADDAPQTKTLRVDDEDAGQRLDNFLMRHLKGVPKTHVYRIIRSGEVRINKGRVSAERRVAAGDMVRLPPVRTSQRAGNPRPMPWGRGATQWQRAMCQAGSSRSCTRTTGCWQIDKPAGVAVHGGSGVSFGVIEQLRMARPQAHFLELVHRLDRETSGILLVAKKRSALKHLQDQFRERETGKTYLALVAGVWPARLKVLDKSLRKYLLPDGERRVQVVPKDHPDAMPSLTLVKVVRQNDAATACSRSPSAPGRTHQIRVHLASEGHADRGRRQIRRFRAEQVAAAGGQPVPLRRMFLHAWRLQFGHPHSGERIQLEAALPTALTLFLDHVHLASD
jgi:23S rRNA pseudouridine955/2504/2580 synthase